MQMNNDKAAAAPPQSSPLLVHPHSTADKKLANSQQPPAPNVTSKLANNTISSSLLQQSSSQRDTQITPPSRLYSHHGSRPFEKDEYLLRLLSKGTKSNINPHSSSGIASSTGFRVPDPVPRPHSRQLATPPAQQQTSHHQAAAAGGSIPSCGFPETAPSNLLQSPPTNNKTVSPRKTSTHNTSAWSYADTQRAMGKEAAAALRSAVVGHQVAFLEQIYDLHRAIAIQRLLVKNCPEVEQIMTEAERILTSSSSLRAAEVPATKRVRGPADSHGRALHPDSQFAALPLSGETGSGDGSGDDIDGSGGNGSGGNHGSGGGSTSPQPQVAFVPPLGGVPPHMGVAGLQPAPSTASQTPTPLVGWPPMFGGMSPAAAAAPMWGAQMNQYPQAAQLAAMSQGRFGMPGGYVSMPNTMDPMAWWYYNYYGKQQLNGNGGGSIDANGGTSQGQNMTQHTAAAAAAVAMGHQQQNQPSAASPPPPPPPSSVAAVQQQQQPVTSAATMAAAAMANAQPAAQMAYKWWQDAQTAFGSPPGDPGMLFARGPNTVTGPQPPPLDLRRMASMLTQTNTTNGAPALPMEVESAPPSAMMGMPSSTTLSRQQQQQYLRGGLAKDQHMGHIRAVGTHSAGKHRHHHAATTNTTTTTTNNNTNTNNNDAPRSHRHHQQDILVAPPSSRPRRRKRKPADPIEEASSGTTGIHDGNAHSHAIPDTSNTNAINRNKRSRSTRRPVETMAAELLLSINEQGAPF